ncbi:MAG: universal stress protein [Bacteroidota bacterium]
MKNVLICIDFTERTEWFIHKAISLVKPRSPKLWLLHVAAPEPDFVGYDVGPQYERDFRAETLRTEHRMLQEYSNRLKDEGFKAEGLLIAGPTLDIILEESKKLHIDLIIAGRQEHGFLHKLFFDSTSTGIIRRSDIPVLMIPLDMN